MDAIRFITNIEELDKKRSKVYIDYEFAFVLYKGEIRQYKLEIGQALEEQVYFDIKKKLLPKRAKKRCLNLLQKRILNGQ